MRTKKHLAAEQLEEDKMEVLTHIPCLLRVLVVRQIMSRDKNRHRTAILQRQANLVEFIPIL